MTTPIVVLDNGSGDVKAGFAGEGRPRIVVPNCQGTLIGYESRKEKVNSDLLYGHANFYTHRPSSQGFLADLDMQSDIWRSAVFSNHRNVDGGPVWGAQGLHVGETGVLVTEPFNSCAASRQGLYEILFEDFQFNQVMVSAAQQLVPYSFSVSAPSNGDESTSLKFMPFVAQRTPTGGVRTGRRGRPPKRPPQPCGFDCLTSFGVVEEFGDPIGAEPFQPAHVPGETVTGLPVADPFAPPGWVSPCAMVIDVGHSHMWALPTCDGVPLDYATRRTDFGGHHLSSYLNKILSTRQVVLESNQLLVRSLMEDLCFCSTNFLADCRRIQSELSSGRSSVTGTYTIPDYTSTSSALNQILRGRRKINQFPHKCVKLEEEGRSKGPPLPLVTSDAKNGIINDIAEGPQYITVNHERIAIPELLFHPSDAPSVVWTPKEAQSNATKSEEFAQKGPAGLGEVVARAVVACPPELQPYFASSIQLSGGCAKFPYFRERLYAELRALLPDVSVIPFCHAEVAYSPALPFRQSPVGRLAWRFGLGSLRPH